MLKSPDISHILSAINDAQSIVLSTHRECDGDGLGAILGLYHALKTTSKEVRILCVDDIPKKYHFLHTKKYVQVFEGTHTPLENHDLTLIFDTNDSRLIEPLYSKLQETSEKILFVDHHPILDSGPQPTENSLVDTNMASTGEIAYFIIKALDIPFNTPAAEALYTSITFDTQFFRYVKGSANSHLICAELIQFLDNPELIHQELFSTYSLGKMSFLAMALNKIEYYANGRIACLEINFEELNKNNIEPDDTRDIIDMIMNVKQVKAAILIREDAKHFHRLSLRGKAGLSVLPVAEAVGGGGHKNASGAYLKENIKEKKSFILEELTKLL